MKRRRRRRQQRIVTLFSPFLSFDDAEEEILMKNATTHATGVRGGGMDDIVRLPLLPLLDTTPTFSMQIFPLQMSKSRRAAVIFHHDFCLLACHFFLVGVPCLPGMRTIITRDSFSDSASQVSLERRAKEETICWRRRRPCRSKMLLVARRTPPLLVTSRRATRSPLPHRLRSSPTRHILPPPSASLPPCLLSGEVKTAF